MPDDDGEAMPDRCEHPRLICDNVVTSCADCGEDWTAVTTPGWPLGVASMRFGRWAATCSQCNADYLEGPMGGLYCPLCDMMPMRLRQQEAAAG